MTLSIDDSLTVRSGADEQPLLVLLHGYGSHEGDLAGLVPHLPAGLATASVRAPLTLAEGAYAWVPIRLPGRPEPVATAEATDALLEWLDATVAPDRRVALLGFSQGGLMVTQLLRARPQAFVAGVVLSGFVLDGWQPGDDELAQRRPPVFLGRGDDDAVITADATARAEAWLPDRVALERHVYPGLPHAVNAEELSDVSAFLAAHVLQGVTR